MNTKGVEDGITDEQDGCECKCCFSSMSIREGCEPTKYCDTCAQDLLRDIEAVFESIKPGPRQATPFMPTLPVPERTAEMEQLREALTKLANEVSGWLDFEPVRLAMVMGNTNVAVLRERLTIARGVLDHIEGKAKAVSQEVKESCDCRKLCGCSIASKPHCHYCRFGMESK